MKKLKLQILKGKLPKPKKDEKAFSLDMLENFQVVRPQPSIKAVVDRTLFRYYAFFILVMFISFLFFMRAWSNV